MKAFARAALFSLLALAGAPAAAQEPPVPEPVPKSEQEEKEEGGGQEQEQEKRDDPVPAPKDEEKGQENGGQEQQEQVQDPPAPEVQDGPGSGEVTPLADAPQSVVENAQEVRQHPRIDWPLDGDAIAQHLRGIATTHAGMATLETIGRSAGGRDILALRLSAPAAAPGQAEKPTLLVVDFQGPASAGPEAMLELAWTLAERFETDERVRTVLQHTTLVLAPALDPDARAGAPGSTDVLSEVLSDVLSDVLFDRNFPSGWQPASLRSGSGRVSLSEPETLAAARFLTGLRQAALVVGFVAPRPAGEPYPESEVPEEDRAVFARLSTALELEGAAPVVSWPELGSPGGGLFDFAYQARGIYPLLVQQPAPEELAPGRLAAFGAEMSERVLRCLELLPRIEVQQEGLERLSGDTWQLDVRFQNVGLVPTQSALARRREPGCEVVLRLDGAKLVATARRPDGGATFTDAAFQVRPSLTGGTLGGGEGRLMRLILAGSSGAEVRLTAGAPRAGSSTLTVLLP